MQVDAMTGSKSRCGHDLIAEQRTELTSTRRMSVRSLIRGATAVVIVSGVILFATPMSAANILVDDAERDLFLAKASALKAAEALATTQTELATLREQHDVASSSLTTATAAVNQFEHRLGEIHDRLGEAETDRVVTIEDHAATRQGLIDTAVGAYIEGAPVSTQMSAMFTDDPSDRAQSMAYAMVITESLDERARDLQVQAIELGDELTELADELTRVEQSLITFRDDVIRAQTQVDDLNAGIASLEDSEAEQIAALQIIEFGVVLAESRLADAHKRAEEEQREYEAILKRINREMVADDIPARAFQSYRQSAERLRTEQPACAIPWWFLAAIGRVESRHGSSGGAVIAPNGDVRPRIIGPRLDGSRFARILDSDNGHWDGDTEYDRAVGPMQFIPTTWAASGADANGDGIKDPHNFDDAALASARYLCRGARGHSLRTVTGMQHAAFSYNRSMTYVSTVIATAQVYGGPDFPTDD